MTEQELLALHPRYLASRIGDSNATIDDIPDIGSADEFSIAVGYPEAYAKPYDDGGKPLNRSEVNNVFNLLSQLHFYWQMGGIPMWNREVAQGINPYSTIGGYPKNANVYKNINGKRVQFVSNVDDNSEEPGPNVSTWTEIITANSLVPQITALCSTIASLSGIVATLSGNAKTADATLQKAIDSVSSSSSSTIASLSAYVKKSELAWFDVES